MKLIRKLYFGNKIVTMILLNSYFISSCHSNAFMVCMYSIYLVHVVDHVESDFGPGFQPLAEFVYGFEIKDKLPLFRRLHAYARPDRETGGCIFI